MTTKPKQQLPKGLADFSALRARNLVYVDKTDLIYRLALEQSGMYFLARPRRFGKTLLLSTFESLFKYGLRDFKGLAIEKLWKDNRKYSVVKLDFSDTKNVVSVEYFEERLRSLIISGFSPYGFKFDRDSLLSASEQLSDWLRTCEKNSMVLLIDEYDAPLTACLNDEKLFNEVRGKLFEFFGKIKKNTGVLRFFFMTGITKFSKASIFSELNNLTDISLDPQYGTLLGYTCKEIDRFFGEYVDQAVEVLKWDRPRLMHELAEYYDGFCFEETAQQKVFAPWSLLSFLASPNRKLQNYWVDSAGSLSILQQYLKSKTLRNPNEYFAEKFVKIHEMKATATDSSHINELVLLTQAGYLTIKSVVSDSFAVGYPNKEVADSLANIYRDELLANKSVSEVGAKTLNEDLLTGKVDSVVKQLNILFLATDYKQYGVKDEATCRNYTQLFLTLGAGVKTYSELHNALGRSDLEVDTHNVHWVFEIKFLQEEKSGKNAAPKLLADALRQIKERHYGEAFSAGKKLLRVGLVFSEKERQFVKYDLAD